MILTDNMYQEKKEEEDLPTLKIAWMHQYKDSIHQYKDYIKKRKERLIIGK